MSLVGSDNNIILEKGKSGKRCCISCESFTMEDSNRVVIAGLCGLTKEYKLATDSCEKISVNRGGPYIKRTTRGRKLGPQGKKETNKCRENIQQVIK